jgi:hypothetical protein
MHSIELSSWEGLVAEVDRLQLERIELAKARQRHCSDLLFRGQRDAGWKLVSTLERCAPALLTFAEYFRLISRAKPQIETFSRDRWELPDYGELAQWATHYDNLKLTPFPGYDYLAYLRHHGFPSPLLDWTRSLAIASFFAFEDAVEHTEVAIYVYAEDRGWGKTTMSVAPQIASFGPYVRSHPRHFNQQSSYTMCCHFQNGPWKFASHELVYGESENDQDRLWKFVLPATEKMKVLRLLDASNINPYSLFGSEESLLKTIANRELLLRDASIA